MVLISFKNIGWLGKSGFCTVLHLVCLVLMVAMLPTHAPSPPPSPFSTKCRLLSSWPALVEKGEGGGEGAPLLSVCTKLCSMVAPT